ncbi:RNA polymerase sigma factor [Chitinimonas naiadis]
MAPDPLIALLARIGLGDAQAFETFYQATSPRLYAVALRMVRRADWAEDILQECYVKIWHAAASYAQEQSQPYTWLIQIVRNRCLDWLRRPAMEDSAEDEGQQAFEQHPDQRAGPLQQLLQADEAQSLKHCLEALEVRPRELILMAYFQGLSHSELAQRLSLPLGSVKSWVRRGLMQLRGCLSL